MSDQLVDVLFVDDTDAIREFMQEIFETYGITYLIFSTITEARHHLNKANAVITDGNVERKLDGLDFARELHAANVKVMLYTSMRPEKGVVWPFKYVHKGSALSDFKTEILPWLKEA